MIKTAFILAAGFGKRMQPWTFLMPKPLLSMGGKPVIVRHIEKLADSGVRHILINVHHLGYKLRSFIEYYFYECLKPEGIKLTLLEENKILGTGGALFQAREYIPDENFFLINSDIIYDLDLKVLSDFHEKHGQIASLVVQKTENEKLKQVSFSGNGLIEKIAGINFCTTPKPSSHVFTGIHAVNKRIFNYCMEKKELCIIRHIYPLAFSGGEKLMAMETNSYWCDMGDISGFEKLHRDLIAYKIE